MDFALLDDDTGFLNTDFNGKWDAIVSNVERGIIIKNYPLPDGYSHKEVEMMILVPQDYPGAALDMFYISPEITKTNGKIIRALNIESHFDRHWQRWSRHYTWQVGIHNIATHLQVVANSLTEELDR